MCQTIRFANLWWPGLETGPQLRHGSEVIDVIDVPLNPIRVTADNGTSDLQGWSRKDQRNSGRANTRVARKFDPWRLAEHVSSATTSEWYRPRRPAPWWWG